MKLKRLLIFFLVILLLSIISILYNPNPTGNAVKQDYYPKETAILERVIDGDTIVYRIGNISQSCRLLGINTPEKNMPFSNDSKNFLKKFENKTIILERDKEDTDKYDRKLRYIYYENRFINLEILELGLANSYYIIGLKYEKQILNAESQARNSGIGIWTKSNEPCSINNCILLKELNSTSEFFIIQNICDKTCELNRWFVKDAGRNTFYLSNLQPLEEKTYYSKNNSNIWNNEGDKFFMFDKKGYLVIYYEYKN